MTRPDTRNDKQQLETRSDPILLTMIRPGVDTLVLCVGINEPVKDGSAETTRKMFEGIWLKRWRHIGSGVELPNPKITLGRGRVRDAGEFDSFCFIAPKSGVFHRVPFSNIWFNAGLSAVKHAQINMVNKSTEQGHEMKSGDADVIKSCRRRMDCLRKVRLLFQKKKKYFTTEPLIWFNFF